MVNDMRNKTRALQTKIGVGLPKIRPRLNSFTRAVTTSSSSSKSGAPINFSALGFGWKENQRQPPQQQPARPRHPGWVVVQMEEEEEENQAGDTRKTPRVPRVKDVFTPTPIQSRARAILRPRRSDSDTSRPEITPLRFGGFGLGMRSGSRASGRSSLSSASEAESGGERFGSLGKAARLSFASESDSDLDAILKIRDSADTVKATPKPKPRHSVPARTLSREDSSILMPPPSSHVAYGKRRIVSLFEEQRQIQGGGSYEQVPPLLHSKDKHDLAALIQRRVEERDQIPQSPRTQTLPLDYPRKPTATHPAFTDSDTSLRSTAIHRRDPRFHKFNAIDESFEVERAAEVCGSPSCDPARGWDEVLVVVHFGGFPYQSLPPAEWRGQESLRKRRGGLKARPDGLLASLFPL
ncbi:hypothetical protein FRC00_000809 [Tulasnella sp. 408]|nr:hypothetical protein FRC00_000809 [Tulasnella sp. 408]